MIFLVLAGLKPVSEVAAGHWVQTPTGRRTEPDSPTGLGGFLSSLGLAYDLTPNDHITVALVSRSRAVLNQYLHVQSQRLEAGLLLGYPHSAVTAFVNGRLMSFEQQEHLVRDAGLAQWVHFRLSKMHANEELEVVMAVLVFFGAFIPFVGAIVTGFRPPGRHPGSAMELTGR
jgi:hypothetical protein